MAQHQHQIHNLLNRMTSADKDFRFMATNDLMGELQRDNIMWDDDSEYKVTNQILNLLKDKNGEVQNLAVKCLGYLVAKIKDDRKQLVIRNLCEMLKHQEEPLRDIASIALKTVVSEIPINSKKIVDILNVDLNSNLCVAIANNLDVNVQLESLDILTELINRCGSQLSMHHEEMQSRLFKQLESDRSAVRKRSMNALSYLMACCSDDLFHNTIQRISQALISLQPTIIDQNHSSSNGSGNQKSQLNSSLTAAKTLLQCFATIIRLTGHRSKVEQLNEIIPVIYRYCQIHDDELREYCLQAFEAYVKRCLVKVNDSLPLIINLCLADIAHDPNYHYDIDEDDDNDRMDTDLTEDDESESAEDYSDDDDLSWKVRRASAKCLEAIINSRADLVNDFFETVAPVLVSRFKEREESVKSDIIQTFVALLKLTRGLVNDTKLCHQASRAMIKLTEMIPTIVVKSTSLLKEKSIKTRQIVFQMFTEIMNIKQNALSGHINVLVPAALHSLVDKNSTSNMRLDALNFMKELLKTHEPTLFHSEMNIILPDIVTAVQETFYKISSEALSLLSQLVCVIRPSNYQAMPDFDQVALIIYEKTIEQMSKTDVDIEIKEQAITCMGQIIATFGDVLPKQSPIALRMLYQKLNNETTRLTCIKALIKIANSPLSISLDCIFPAAFEILASFLRKNFRPLRISTLILIENVVRRYPDLLDAKTANSIILVELPGLIEESDLYVSQLTLTTLTTIINTHNSLEMVLPEKVFTETLQLVRSPLLQGSALQSVLQFFSALVSNPFPGYDHAILLKNLVGPIYSGTTVHKQAFNSTAKAISAISIGDETRAARTVKQLINDCLKFKTDSNRYALNLLSLGEMSRVKDLGDTPQLVDVILEAFNFASEDVKSAGSYALGCAAVGNIDKFLPIILHEIEARNKRQYLILYSLREVISAGQLKELETIWLLLLKHCECHEEGTRNVVSECLGKLTLINARVLLPRLIDHLKQDYADKPLARSTIVAAIKFMISDQPQEIDDLLRQHIGEFLNSLQDPDINVRRVALITFNSATHNKPSLIFHLLPDIMPLLYNETLVKQELIRQVEMGPFKHQVDDGLDTRKAAFECMYTLLDTCQNHLDIFEFLTHVEDGLRDHYDIKMLTYLMLNRLATLCPAAVLRRLDRLIIPIEEVCRTKPKDDAVKQEHEKQDELKRSALRAFDALRSIPDADRHLFLDKFYRECVKGDKELSKLYASIHRDSLQLASDLNDRMDTTY